MHRRWLLRSLASLLLAASLGVGLWSCEDDLTEPGKHRVGELAPEVRLDAAAAAGVPSGGLLLENFRLIADTAGVSDVFAREGADGYYVAAQNRYRFESGVRVAGQDPRLPALAALPDPELFVTVFAILGTPERFGVLLWDFFMRWDGLELGQTYTYSVERLATQVNGALDQVEFLLEGEVTEPDELVPLDGSPGGYPTNDYTWTSASGCTLEPIDVPPPNPWYLGPFAASSTGRGTADFCMGTPWQWYAGISNVPDSSIVALNELRRGVVPHYNYVVIYEGEPPNLGPPVIRIQMGADFDLAGNPIPNAFAPFPVAADRELALALPNVQAAPSRIRFEMRDLEPLASDMPYEVWLINAETGNSIPATAEYFTIETVIQTDELGQQFEVDVPSADTVEAASFRGVAVSNVRHAFVVRNSLIAPDNLGEFTHVALARPGVQGSATDPMFWAQYLDQSGTPTDPGDDIFIAADDFKLGALDLVDPAVSRLFRVSGSGDGLIWQNQMGLQFRRLSRPPLGYQYEVWLIDTSGAALSVGTITTPAPDFESLDQADLQVHPQFMTETQILQAARFVDLPSGLEPSELVEIQLTLEPKAGAAVKGPTLILSGALPEGFFK